MMEELEKILESEELSLEERSKRIYHGCRIREFYESATGHITEERYLELSNDVKEGEIVHLKLGEGWVPMIKYKGLIVPPPLARR